MSTTTRTSHAATSLRNYSAADGARLTFGRVLHSEWLKFRTLRSTVWTLVLTVVLMVGFSLLFAIGVRSADGEIPGVTGASVVTGGYFFGQLTLAVLGVLVISGEYTTGMIRSTLAAVPTRLPALWAKALVLAVTAFVVGVVSVAISHLATRAILAPFDLVPDLANSEDLRIMLGSAAYLSAISLLAFAFGALLRHSAAALAAVLGLLLVVENVFRIPLTFFQEVGPFLPSTAGAQIMMPQEALDALAQTAVGTVLDPWQGFAVLLAYVVVLLTLAAALLKRRDA